MDKKSQRRATSALMWLCLFMSLIQPAYADGGWTTKGGHELRTSAVTEGLGLMKAEDWWQEDLGQSATQPVVVGNTVYHLAGKYLWRLDLDEAGRPQGRRRLGDGTSGTVVNRDPDTEEVKVSSSTPTFSPKGIIYFGTAYGYVWAYDTATEAFRSFDVGDCPIVSSPMVLTIGGREVVIFGDKADGCAGGGNLWAIWGLDGTGTLGNARLANGDIGSGSWATPSPVKGTEENVVIAGSDGDTCHGRATGVRVVPAGNGFDFDNHHRVWKEPICSGSGGFAGSFASDGTNVYWADTYGTLWKRMLSNGLRAEGWPEQGLNLPRLIHPSGTGFTNTEPAIDLQAGPDQAQVYVTLRNYKQPGDPFTLRGCGSERYPVPGCSEPGAPGAIVAVKGDASLAWYKRFLPGDSTPADPGQPKLYYPAINTAPLVIKSRNAVVFGDVNGTVHSYYLTSGEPALLGIDDACRGKSTYPLLKEGEWPTRGNSTFSQVAGVGVDPALANRLLLFGVNYRPPDGAGDGKQDYQRGRLVAVQFGKPYNLAWASGELSPEGPLKPDQPAAFEGVVTLSSGERSLGELRPDGVAVEWWVVDEQLGTKMKNFDPAVFPTLPGYKRRLGLQDSLSATLLPGGQDTANFPLTLTADDPEKGYVVGIIDPDTLALYDNLYIGDLVQALAEWGGRPARCFLGIREYAEMPSTPGGDGFVDNYTLVPYEKQMPLDLAVEVEAPAYVDFQPAGFYEVTIRHRNLSGARVVAPGVRRVLTQISTSLGTQDINRRPYVFEPFQEVVQTYRVPMGDCDSRSIVRVTLNEANSPAEADLSNNVAQVLTVIGPCTSEPGSGNVRGGEGRSIIVPPDCIPNPDLTDPRPCTNYDKTVDDW